MEKRQGANYNQRLFSGGFRGYFHRARFVWLNRNLSQFGGPQESVMELGCYDGKTIRHLPVKPRRYVGYDENWEGGLPLAKRLWAGEPSYEFHECSSPEQMPTDELFDVVICMETLEHVPPRLIEPYVARMAQMSRGRVFITVPTEKGLVFALKYLCKRLLGNYQRYTLAEFFWASVGRLDEVARDDHKGFDYQVVIDAVSRHFRLEKASPYPLQALPLWLGFGVGIVGTTRDSA